MPRKALPRSGLAEGDWLAKAAKDALTAGCVASVFDAMFSALGSGGVKEYPCAPPVVSDRSMEARTRLSAGGRRKYVDCSNPQGRKMGEASGRERVCRYVERAWGAG